MDDREGELAASRRREAALAGVLAAVANSTGDLTALFGEIAFHAAMVTGADQGFVFMEAGDRLVMYVNGPEAKHALTVEAPNTEQSGLVHVLRGKPVLRFDDQSIVTDPELAQSAEAAQRTGFKSAVQVRVPSGTVPLGIGVHKYRIDPFTDADVEILQYFAAQAGNALVSAQQRHDAEQRSLDLAEALELQTATSEVLRLISAHPGDLHTVLQGILAKAAELCGGEAGSITMGDGDGFRYVASYGPAMEPYIGTSVESGALSPEVFDVSPEGVLHADDFAATTVGIAYFEELAAAARVRSYAMARLTGGGLHMYRHEVRLFSASELARLASFAAQASLAIGNAQLFNDLDAALERQTATSEILRLISASPGDLVTVLDGILVKAAELCDADAGVVMVRYGDLVRADAVLGPFKDLPILGGAITPARVTLEARGRRSPVLIDDAQLADDDQVLAPLARAIGFHSFASVPLFHADEWLGNINLSRFDVRPFDPTLVDVMQSFAEQAAIAIANARLFNDLNESLALQTATSEVLQLISANPGNLTVVLEGIVTRAAAFCEAETGVVWLRNGDDLRIAAELESPVSFVGMTVPNLSLIHI